MSDGLMRRHVIPLVALAGWAFGCSSGGPANEDTDPELIEAGGKADQDSASVAALLGSWTRSAGTLGGFRFRDAGDARQFVGEQAGPCGGAACAPVRLEGTWAATAKTLYLNNQGARLSYRYAVSGTGGARTLVLTERGTGAVLGRLASKPTFCNRAADCVGQGGLTPSWTYCEVVTPACNVDTTCSFGCTVNRTAAATLRFRADGSIEQQGAVVAGRRLGVEYEPDRLPTCRDWRNGHPVWDVRVFVRFLPGGQMVQGSVNGILEPVHHMHLAGDAPYLEADVPAEAKGVEIWAQNTSGMARSGCTDWDSAGGQNYGFEVMGTSPAAAVGWAGGWGGGLAPACTHADGLTEPLVVDGDAPTDACLLVDADVAVPGLTDQADDHPEWLAAQAEVSLDGLPPTYEWLAYVGRVGDHYRYRWDVPRATMMTAHRWDRYTFAFRFSTDGQAWYRIGQSDGPAGGEPRTMRPGAP